MSASAGLHATALQVRAVPRRSMIAIAKAAKQIAAQEGTRAGGPLVGKKRRGMKLRAKDDIRDTADGATLRVQGVNPAGWVWVNTGTAPHAIRRRKRGPLRKLTVAHPGTRGRGAWRDVQTRVARLVPVIMSDELGRAVGTR